MGGAAAAPLSMASLGLSAFSAIEKGAGTKAADDYQAARLEKAAAYGRTEAEQTSGQMLENLNVTLGNIDAVRAAAHTDPTSPTGAAIRDATEYKGDRARSIQVGNILAKASQDERDAAYMRSAGSFAMNMSYLNAAAGITKGFGQTDKSGFGFGTG